MFFKNFDFDPDPEMDPEPDPELSEKSDPEPDPDPEIIFSAPTHWWSPPALFVTDPCLPILHSVNSISFSRTKIF